MNDSAVIGRIQARLYEPPAEVEHLPGCRAWSHDEDCDCPTVRDLEVMDADDRNKDRREG